MVGRPPVRPEQGDGIEGHHAVRATTVGDDLAVLRQPPQTTSQVRERDGDGAGDVAGGVLRRRADVDHRHLAASDPCDEHLAVDALEGPTPRQDVLAQLREFGQPRVRERAHLQQERPDGVAGETVGDECPCLLGGDEAALAQDLQML